MIQAIFNYNQDTTTNRAMTKWIAELVVVQVPST